MGIIGKRVKTPCCPATVIGCSRSFMPLGDCLGRRIASNTRKPGDLLAEKTSNRGGSVYGVWAAMLWRPLPPLLDWANEGKEESAPGCRSPFLHESAYAAILPTPSEAPAAASARCMHRESNAAAASTSPDFYKHTEQEKT